ncbi:MAG: RDD family protein [Alphaproteobacteria bacterium]|nr:RDD family protein [Alphaproteobacteria bacterium]
MAEPFNPYAAPAAELEREIDPAELVPAGRGERLVAKMIEGGLYFGLLFGGAVLGAMVGAASELDEGVAVGLMFGVMGLSTVPIIGINLWLMADRGQTIGKVLLGVRIVDVRTGQVPPFWKLLLLRTLAVWALAAAVPFFQILDQLLIFNHDNRCIHDHMAGTLVVPARIGAPKKG